MAGPTQSSKEKIPMRIRTKHQTAENHRNRITVEAEVRFGDSLSAGETYRVIADGAGTVTFTAP